MDRGVRERSTHGSTPSRNANLLAVLPLVRRELSDRLQHDLPKAAPGCGEMIGHRRHRQIELVTHFPVASGRAFEVQSPEQSEMSCLSLCRKLLFQTTDRGSEHAPHPLLMQQLIRSETIGMEREEA